MDHHPVGSMGVAHLPYGGMPFYHTSPLGTGSTSPPTNHLMMGVPDPRMLAHSSSEPDFSDRDREQHLPVNKRRKVVYLCESCGTSYTEKRALARHKHTNQHRRNLGLPPAQRYPCTTCDKSFSRDHDRVRHENETHKGFKRSAQRGGTVASSSHSESPPPLPLKDASNASDSFSSTDGDSHNTPASSATSHSRNSSNAFVSGTGADACDWHGDAGEPPQMKGPASYHFPPPLAHAKSTPSFNTSGSGIHMGSMQDRSWFNEDDSDSDESPDANNRRLALQSGDDDDDAAGNNDEDDDGDDDEEDDDEYLRGLVYPPMRSTSTADSAIDMEWSQEREPKFPTIVTYDHRGESSDRDTTAEEQWDQLAPLSTSVAQSRLKPTHKSAIVRHGTTQMIGARSPLFCAFCKTPFEDDPETLLPHLRKHLESLKGEHRCKTCDIGFTHRADLDRHNASVDFFGYCGFSFNHTKPCTGHHPPSPRRSTEVMGDHDSVQLFAQLRNWEHAQLRTYIAEIQDLLSTRSSRASACYSVDALYRRSRDSFASVAVSINTLESAPCDGGGDTKRGMGGLQQRLRMMSLKNSANPPSTSKGHRHELRPNKNPVTMLM